MKLLLLLVSLAAAQTPAGTGGGTAILRGRTTLPESLTCAGSDVAIDTPTFVTDCSNDLVGIGTPDPSTKLEVLTSAAANLLTLTNTNAGAAGSILDLYHNTASPAASDVLGKVLFNTKDSGAVKQSMVELQAVAVDVTSTTEDGRLDIYVTLASTSTNIVSITGSGLGIGSSAPSVALDVVGAVKTTGDVTINTAQTYASTFTTTGYLAVLSSQTVADTNTVTANACGGTKILYAAGAVTTDTTNTFTAPGATNVGCKMDVCATTLGGNITLDANANFKSAGGANVVLTSDDCISVMSDGVVWRQVSALLAN